MSRIAVTNLKISHFRSYKNVEILTSGCPVALFGSNGAGKTNILEALSLLSLEEACAARVWMRWSVNLKVLGGKFLQPYNL